MRKNFLIVGTQRTGSTVLFESLNLHPEIACGAEWPRRVGWHKKVKVTQRGLTGDFTALTPRHRQRITEVYHRQTRWLGCKVLFRSSDKWLIHPCFSPALWLDRLEDYLRWISGQPHIHIIHLTRCDAIEWLKSKYMAQMTKVYTGKRYPDDLKVEIPLRRAVKRLYAKNWIDDRLATVRNSNPYRRIYYEDFLASSYDVVVSVLQFLQCDAMKLPKNVQDKQRVQRQSKGSAADYIANYDNLMRKLEQYNLLDKPM